jgi:spore coat protein U-like protein
MQLRVVVVALLVGMQCVPATGWTQSFTVTAEVVEGCAINGSTQSISVAFGTLSFGTHPAVHAGPVDGSVMLSGAPVQLQCTPNLALDLAIGAGLHATAGQRQLQHTGNSAYRVQYNLYTTAAHTTAIPTTGSTSVTIPGSGVLTLPVYGVAQLPGTGLLPGAYTDSLQVTVTW